MGQRSDMIKLSPRLQTVADFAPPSNVVADIGTDHGFLAIYLVQANKARSVIAADKNKMPLESAARAVREYNLSERVELRLGDGLAVLAENEAETIILAGMGGALMADILAAHKNIWQCAASLVLQPQNGFDVLRRYVCDNGWHIADEKIAAEGKRLYVVMLAQKGTEPLPEEFYLKVGKKLVEKNDPLLPLFLDNIIETERRRAEGLRAGTRRADVAEKLRTTEEYIEKLTEQKRRLKNHA